MSDEIAITFNDLGLPDSLLASLSAVGYENPTPIQAATIPPLLEGRDVLGTAQTGTGKTAAFALPILAHIDLSARASHNPQALVLAPTRELAIQVAEAFQRYASHIPGFHVLPIYGGQSYTPQLRGLQRGAHVVVGTPGRVIDHLEKGSLDLSHIKTLVLDEADEMLRMGFVDDVEAVLKRIPDERRIALFSATMPRPIARIAETYLRNPVRVAITSKTTTPGTVRQRYWQVSGMHKLDALTRILEVEPFEAMIVFSRTKLGTEELAQKLEARGFSAAAINGDVQQAVRERTIGKLKDGSIDILVATDVAARGLDVERISHVVNFDIPVDTESYVHRIGRTGRAGRAGDAILFVTPRERHLLRAIERATRQPIEEMTLPSVGDVNDVRIARFKERIVETLAEGGLDTFRQMIESFETDKNVPAVEIAAALAKMVQGKKPLLLKPERDGGAAWGGEAAPVRERSTSARSERAPREFDAPRAPREFEAPRTRAPREFDAPRAPREFDAPRAPREFDAPRAPREFDDGIPSMRPRVKSSVEDRFAQYEGAAPPRDEDEFARPSPRRSAPRDGDKQTYKVAVGNIHQIKPGNIVGAIANEAGLDSAHIGRIEIFDDYTLVDLPAGMPAETFQLLKKVRVAQQMLMIEPWDGKSTGSAPRRNFDDSNARSERSAPARSGDSAPKSHFDAPRFAKTPFGAARDSGFKKPGFSRPDDGFKPRFNSDTDAPRKSYGDKPSFDKPSFGKPAFGKPNFDRASKPSFERGPDRPSFAKPGFDKPSFAKPGFAKPGFKKSEGSDRPARASAGGFDKPRKPSGTDGGFAPPGKRKFGANPFKK